MFGEFPDFVFEELDLLFKLLRTMDALKQFLQLASQGVGLKSRTSEQNDTT